jgi:hypothetical protein
MKKKIKDGNPNKALFEKKSGDSLPEISQSINGLNNRDSIVVYAIVNKMSCVTWDGVAAQIGITRRQLFNLRREKRIQDAVREISHDFLISDLPDVYKTLTKKAKKGETSAMRLYFELAGEFDIHVAEEPSDADPMQQMIDAYRKAKEANNRDDQGHSEKSE